MKTVRLTMSQALILFLDNQYVSLDGQEYKFIKGILGIFGHGNVTGIGEAIEFLETNLIFMQGHNEQGMVHTATAFAKQKNRLQIMACTSSIGPGALNMVTAAATATINRIPVLLLPGDIFACRQPDPVLQQMEVFQDYTVSANDCFKPVSRYWDRISRPEQLMTALRNAMRVLTDPVDTGAVTLCLPQDVQTEAFHYPVTFFEKKVHHIDRRLLPERMLHLAVNKLSKANNPLIIAGGGVHYSLACQQLEDFAETFGIPVAETQAGKSAMNWKHAFSVGGIGVTGTAAANLLAKEADVVLVVGSRLTDFTTASKTLFQNPDVQLLHLNVNAVDANKMNAIALHADAKVGLETIKSALLQSKYHTPQEYYSAIQDYRFMWNQEVDRLHTTTAVEENAQVQIIGMLNQFVGANDIIVCAAGSLPGDLHRLWRSVHPGTYHVEYGFSCMGYEVAGGLGVKMANPEVEVYVLVGDGSYLMLHSELLTSIQESIKINIIIFNNHGFQCINNLQKANGSQGFGNEFRYRSANTKRLDGQYLPINFSQYAASLGAIAYHVDNVEQMKEVLPRARAEKISTVITINVAPHTMSNSYDSWWRVDVAEHSPAITVQNAHHQVQEKMKSAKTY